MKNKYIKILKITAIVISVIVLCNTLTWFFDYFLNGALVDWFTANYTHSAKTSDGQFVYDINWEAMKTLFLQMLLVISALCFVTARLYSTSKVRKSIADTGKMISRYMNSGSSAGDIFPPEYSEVSAQIVEIKANMEHNAQILRSEAARKNDLIIYLAHDLKTPLTSIIGYLSLLDEIPDMPLEQRAKYVKITREKALRLETLINEFFDITRYNLQQISLEKETIDLNYMLIQMTDEFYPLLSAHGNTIELTMDDGLTVSADPVRLARVFNNVLKNAVAYSYPNTPISVTAGKRADKICVTISDRGKTIPPHKLSSIFEKFFRLDEARSTNTGGAGLGLAIAKEIIELHGGTITAASENEETTFLIELPA